MMTLRAAFAATVLLGATLVQADNELFGLHGSGTTNPSKCFWILMDQMEDQLRSPVKLSYRAVGSSTGIAEFAGADNGYLPYNDFGAGDIPVPQETYDAITTDTVNGGEVLHFPFAMGAISIFHSIPGVPSGTGGLNMTSCLIARIFKREITAWDHDDILAKNPTLKDYLPSAGYPINLAHRVKGSSSTASVTAYLADSCPALWPNDDNHVGSTINWPPAGDHVFECEGSGGMTNCIRDNPGTIGYIDSGHGHAENLNEVELKNKFGTILSSKEAAAKQGIAAAASNTALPSDLTASFADIDFLNKDGEYTWPIVAMTYVFVRKDITFIENPIEQGLLKAWLKTLYDDDAFAMCTQFGFTAAPTSIKTKAMEAIDSILTSDGTPEFTVEKSTNLGAGQGPYVISAKRRSGAEYVRSTLQGQVDEAQSKTVALSDQVNTLNQKVLDLEANSSTGGGSSSGMTNAEKNLLEAIKNDLEDLRKQLNAVEEEVESTAVLSQGFEARQPENEFTDKHEDQLNAALAMSALAIVLWGAAIVGFIVKRVLGL
mmetsp:Transcript_21052/g.29709  ORF Transcript_21052/g.29709 Transcript_21052/m.29709 type:complete len:545 (+) Transcript_21052:70-1704(+)